MFRTSGRLLEPALLPLKQRPLRLKTASPCTFTLILASAGRGAAAAPSPLHHIVRVESHPSVTPSGPVQLQQLHYLLVADAGA